MSGECRPAFTVFISPQVGKAFEVLGKRHSISRLLKCLLYSLFLLVRPKLKVKADNQGSRFTPLNFSKKRSRANLTGVCPKTFFSSIINN
jgi:hypothetical protein